MVSWLRKATATSTLFHRDCNVICKSYCVAIAMKICDTATPIHGAMAKFANR